MISKLSERLEGKIITINDIPSPVPFYYMIDNTNVFIDIKVKAIRQNSNEMASWHANMTAQCLEGVASFVGQPSITKQGLVDWSLTLTTIDNIVVAFATGLPDIEIDWYGVAIIDGGF